MKNYFLNIFVIIPFLVSTAFSFSHHGVHPLPKKGPWFEGWYVRISDAQTDSSYALIVASQISSRDLIKNKKIFPGYLAVLAQEGDGKTESFESFPQQTTILNNGKPFHFETEFDNENFEWQASHQGWFNSNGFHVSVPGKIEIKAQFKGRTPWDPNSSLWGPEGFGTFLKFIPLHWFVHSLASEVEYTVKTINKDKSVTTKTSRGIAHIEKNWGKVFPEAWMWVQGYNPEKQASLALAGGIVRIAGIPAKSYLVGYRSPKVNAYFQIGQMFDFKFQDIINPCKGTFQIKLENGEHTMILKAKADPKTFGSVSIPTENGYKENGGIESFSTEIDVEIHNNNWIRNFVSSSSLIEKVTFKKAALEFGAAFMDTTKCPKY